ncbi:LacI family DNA-binding transcriptional regulator [Aestuariibacter sp. A3R04]|uniref:LacI family DNA-binding transcriptional regulator n=1 Tax=Aestuariibacter sp. A3R04 TaxID=2841571 RepID=UPI001C092594|nr:LacI family DNA-binding transcriptional regulator [Aestuariibacter sp. A3R04]MBU3021483.1 LacI family transcriptional regulator [Aestuariibacter sp. A3R04]
MTTMRRVSEIAGVSKSTVSRALKNPEMVSKETRDRIYEAVREVGYKPNALAQHFNSGKSNTIVVLVTDITNAFYSRIIKGIELAAQPLGYSVLLGDACDDENRERMYADMLHTSRADGLILLHHRFPFDADWLQTGTTKPIVSVCIPPVEPYNYPHIVIDNFAASREVALHLIKLGHRKIAAIAGQDNGQITKDRLGGLKRVLQERGIAFNNDWFIQGEYSKASGENAVEQLMQQDDRPTALYCFNDDIAIGAMKKLRSLGLRVPEDVSVVGFDNSEFGEYVDPPLTTVNQPALEMGKRGMEVLFGLMNGHVVDDCAQYKPYELIIRNSTAIACENDKKSA